MGRGRRTSAMLGGVSVLLAGACLRIPPWPAPSDAAEDAADAADADGAAPDAEPVCACNADVTGDGVVDAYDITVEANCLKGIETDCGFADVDCDQSVTACDAARIVCYFKYLSAPNPRCCSDSCGACWTSGVGCTLEVELFCGPEGFEAGAECPAPDAGPDAAPDTS